MGTISRLFRWGNGRSEKFIKPTRVTEPLNGRASTQIGPDSGVQALVPRALTPHLPLTVSPPTLVVWVSLSQQVHESTTERTRGLLETDSVPLPPCQDSDCQGTPSKIKHPGQLQSQFSGSRDKPHLSDERFTLGAQPPVNDN